MKRGNVLFLILLAIALFAVLSYAVTQSSRSSGRDAAAENAITDAAQITQYATLVEQTVTRLRLSNGCRDTQISFAADSDGDGNWYDADDDYHNPNAPSDFSCHVFHSAGGALQKIAPKASWLLTSFINTTYETHLGYYVFTGELPITDIGLNPGGAESSELLIKLGLLKKEVCFAINNQLGIDNSSISEQVAWYGYSNQDFFRGTYSLQGVTASIGNDTFPSGKSSGCLERNDVGGNRGLFQFYHVLIAR